MDTQTIGNSITIARKKAMMTQERLAKQLGILTEELMDWESGKALPDIENLFRIAEITNTSYGIVFGQNTNMQDVNYEFRDRLFHEENMFIRMRSFAWAEGLDQTYKALYYMREQHKGQFRKKGKFAVEKVLYINHPLTMACQAHAYGIRDDVLLSAILLHDVVEDTGASMEDLPFSKEICDIVELVTFSVPEGMTKKQAKDRYYARIMTNEKAGVVKILDRCNNVSTMAGSFTPKRLAEYIEETEEYVLPVISRLKNSSEYSDLAFLAKYQIISILETIKCLTAQ